MAARDHSGKKLYDATASMIVNLHMQKRSLSEEEMYCLLSILDLITMGKNDYGLIDLLREWMGNDPNSETDDIIKNTLINLDFSDLAAQEENIETIRELISYNKDLREIPAEPSES